MSNSIPKGSLIILWILVLTLVTCSTPHNTYPVDTPLDIPGKLIWQDEFEGPVGQSPDSARWVYDIGTHWGNNQLEWDNDRPENVSLDGLGNLAITAREELFEGQNYTSARIKTKGLFEKTYGRFEARIKLPTGQGMWPAFWLLGGNFGEVRWPDCGEIDIMEYLGQEPSTFHATIHGPGYSGKKGVSKRYDLQAGRFDTEFHVFTLEWRENSLRWYLDNRLIQTVKPQDVRGKWAFDHPFFIILNLAVGGNWVGSPDETTIFPQTMLVDYVRVYE